MIKVLKHTVSYGSLGVDGLLGYKAPTTNDHVLVPPEIGPYDECLSAHAPSALFIETDSSVAVRGALNGSAWIHSGGKCEFWIDHHWIGDAPYSGSPTPWVNLPPGQYLLRARPTHGAGGAHSIWLFRASTLAASGRLALTTIGCYPEDNIKSALRWLHISAAQNGLHLHVFGVAERMRSWYSAKIERMRGWLNVLPDCYSHAVYLDGTDTIVLGGELEMHAALDSFTTKSVIGAETCCWPERSQAWRDGFKADVSERFPQAGGWGGAIRGDGGLLDTLTRIETMRNEWMSGRGPEWLLPFRHFNDDQFLWQAFYRSNPNALALDSRFRLFANMTCTNMVLHHTDRIRAKGGRLVCANGNRPCCAHFSGAGKLAWGPWLGFLGVAR
jgi:hypothetical protein